MKKKPKPPPVRVGQAPELEPGVLEQWHALFQGVANPPNFGSC